MNTTQARCVNGRRHFSQKEQHPLKGCVLCLYRVGFGCKKIGKIVGKKPDLCAKWVRKAKLSSGIESARRLILFNQNKKGRKRKAFSVQQIESVMWDDYKREIKAVTRPDRAWGSHRVAVTHMAIKRQGRRMISDPVFKAKFYARKRVRQFCKLVGIRKKFSASAMLGCSSSVFMSHFESQFRDGMAWANHGAVWEIDHIIPLASARNAGEIRGLCHYTNLQPLLVQENRDKGDKTMKQAALL